MAITEFPRMVGMSVLSSLVSGLVPLLFFRNGVKKNTLLLLLGLSAGILFAIATVDLIPEGIGVSSSYRRASLHPPKGHEHDHDNETAEFGRLVTMVGVGIGFFSLVLLEQIMVAFGATHSHQSEVAVGEDLEQGKHAHRNQSGLSDSFSLTAFAAIAMHSLVDGIVIGGSFRVSSVIGVRVAIAIVLHKVPDGFVVASLLTATNRSRKALWVLGLSCITPVGAVLGFVMLSSIPASVLGGVLGFAAGTFLFIAACGIIPELLHGHGTDVSKPKLPVYAVVFGWLAVLLIHFTIGSHEH